MRPPPVITSYSPDVNVVYNYEGDTRWFEVSTYTRLASSDRKVDVTWTINGTIVQTDSAATSSRCTNTSAKAGVCIVKAIVSDPYGSDEHEWIWKSAISTVVLNG